MPEQSGTNSDSKPSPIKRLMTPKKGPKLAILIVASLVIVGGLGYLGYKQINKSPKTNPNNLGKVGDHIVTKAEVQDTQNALKETGLYSESEEQIKSLVMNYWLYQLIAKEYDIKASDQDASAYLKAEVSAAKPEPNLDINNQYVRYRAYVDLWKSKLTGFINAPRSGAYVLAHFDQNFGGQNTPKLKAMSASQYDALLAADKKYATDFIKDVAAKLKTGSITFDQAIELEKNDPKIGQKALTTFVHSAAFGKTDQPKNENTQDIAQTPGIKDKINNLKPGETSDPFVLKVQTGVALDSPQEDGIWVIVKLDADNSKGQQFDTINAALQHFKQKYGYEVYN